MPRRLWAVKIELSSGKGSPEIASTKACITGYRGWTGRWKNESVEVGRSRKATKDRRTEEVMRVCACV